MFDLGNIVTIGIVLVIVVVYRILDRDNRSLDKVKKYADKLKEEIDAYAEKRSGDLKAYAIDLDVHQKSAREILRQVQVAEAELNSRADSIATMAERIGEYDKALADLKDMSGRVDENLHIIHEESTFVDGLAKAIKSAKENMEALRRELPEIRAEAKDKADDALKELRELCDADMQGMLKTAQAGLDEVNERIAESTQGITDVHARTLKSASENYRRIEAELDNAFKRARDEGERLEDASFGKLRDQIDARSAKLSEALEAKFAAIKENADGKAAKLNEAIETKFGALRDMAREKVAETQGMLKSFKADWLKEADGLVAEAKANAEKEIASLDSRLIEAESKAEQSGAGFSDRLSKLDAKATEAVAALQAKIKEALKAQHDDIVGKQAEIKNIVKEGLAATKDEAENAFKTLESTLAAAKKQAAEAEAEQKLKLAGIEAAIAATEKRADVLVGALNDKFIQRSADMETRVLVGFDERAANLRGLVEGGLERLEASRIDIGKLEKSLRDSMTMTQHRVEKDFSSFAKDVSARHEAFEANAAAEATKLQSTMRALDEDLNALKSHAYADVSEKLKVFEDEFFADLRKRREETDEKLAAWRTESEDKLAKAIHEADEIRTATEKQWLDESRSRAAEVQARVNEGLAKLATQVETHRESITARVAESDKALASLKAAIKADLDEARGAGNAFLKAELERWKHEAGERVALAEKTGAQETAKLKADLESSKHAFASAREELQAELEKTSKHFEASLQKAETEQKTAFASISGKFEVNAAALNKEWAAQRDQIVEGSKSEREAVRSELRGLGESMERLRQELAQKTGQALADFDKSYAQLSADAARKVKESSLEMNGSLSAFRQEAKALDDTCAASRERMAKAMEEDRKERERVFAEMDKQVKAFQAQTRLFERADELKAGLAQAIESMKADLGRMESRKAEMAELETQYSRIKRMEDELNQKIARFLAEKRRIDTMEEDFKRLLSLSQAVDQKLASVTTSNDQLTQIQADMRRLIAVSDEAVEKYDRVEKKSPILDATADAIDKNFQSVTELERNVRTMDADIREIPERIIQLKRSLDEVLAIEPKLILTMDRLDDMDKSMNEAEKRVTELQKAREWLARAETRFEELNKKTTDHLKLLNDILKEEPSRKDKSGAPPLGVQESVRKLAHQGWKVDEIARVVKLSRGEVELILELSGDK